jgi:hypothetical protein
MTNAERIRLALADGPKTSREVAEVLPDLQFRSLANTMTKLHRRGDIGVHSKRLIGQNWVNVWEWVGA